MLLLLFAAPALGGEPVADIIARHTASVDSLQCVTCKVAIKDVYHDVKRQDQFTGEYSRFGDRLKIVSKAQDAADACTADSNSVRFFMARTVRGRQAYSAAVAPRTRKHLSPCDAWQAGLLHLSLPNTIEYVPLADLVAKAKSGVRLVDEEAVSGVPCVKLTLRFDCTPGVCRDGWAVEVWLSQKHDLLVKRCVYEMMLPNGKRQRRDDEVTEFVATTSGAWFPRKVQYSTHIDGALAMTRNVTFDAIKTPPSLPDDAFRIKFHNTTPMTDHLRRTLYDVDESGNRVSPERPLSVALLDSQSASEARRATENHLDTDQEERRVGHWVILGVSLLALVGALVYRKRHRT